MSQGPAAVRDSGHGFSIGGRTHPDAVIGIEKSRAYVKRSAAALEAARGKMTMPLVYFGTQSEPYGVDHIRVYWNHRVTQYSKCDDCGGSIVRESDKAQKWCHHCGECPQGRDRRHRQQMKSARKTRKARVGKGISDYKMRQYEAEFERDDDTGLWLDIDG